jgi:pSer/pThr/pTyr-binding forkhead associated (FHA) protein
VSRPLDYVALARRTPRAEFVATHAHYFLLGRRQLVPARRSTGQFRQIADGATHVVDPVVMREDAGESLGLVLPVRRRGGGAGDISIGRTVVSDIVVPDTLISRHHAFFRVLDDRVELGDAGSANGTFVGGDELPPGGPVRVVAVGDLVRFAHFEFELLDAGGFWDRMRATDDDG